MRRSLAWTLFIVFAGCSGMERSEHEEIRRRNAKGEHIYRNHHEYLFAIKTPAHTPRSPYVWERTLPQITKDFFRCKGSAANPPRIEMNHPEAPVTYSDCEGSSRHGLPVIHSKEGVYPILIELLNYVQERTNKKVQITCGHRCPLHNTYADASKDNQTSKHQIGAEVDFYVQGMEQQPMDVVELILEFYQKSSRYEGQEEFITFRRYEKLDTNVSTKPWFNKEIFIKMHLPSEGRDIDNQHPYPYITLQVRFDRQTKERVVYEWKKAHLDYPRA